MRKRGRTKESCTGGILVGVSISFKFREPLEKKKNWRGVFVGPQRNLTGEHTLMKGDAQPFRS